MPVLVLSRATRDILIDGMHFGGNVLLFSSFGHEHHALIAKYKSIIMKILVLNAGSSSQKICLYDLPDNLLPPDSPKPLWSAQIDWSLQPGQAKLQVQTAHGQGLEEIYPAVSTSADTGRALQTLWQGTTQAIEHPQEVSIVGHRVVHGGAVYRKSTLVTTSVKEAIEQLSTFAPIHNPANLAGIMAIEQILGPRLPQVAVFDTAFHSHLPAAAYTYPGSYEWLEQGIRRYGFHGISHQYCAQRAAHLLGRDLSSLKIITCHLGNGCSLAAIQNGQSIDTTMGFTPLEGLMMGSRSGSIDPGILLHFLGLGSHTVEQLDHLLNHESGLRGISGLSNDLRQILVAIEQGNERAQLAFDMFIHRLRTNVGAMVASLGGVDALVFTAGIGENSAAVRSATCQNFEFLGLSLDLAKNNAHPIEQDIAAHNSKVRILVVHTEEDWAIAQECHRLAQAMNYCG
jgi:acetate kinase